MIPDEFAQYLVLMVIVYVISMLWAIASYIITSISLFGIGKHLQIKAYGLAWVPVVNVWSVGAIADKYDEQISKDHKFRWVLIWFVIAFVLFMIAFILLNTINVLGIINAPTNFDIEPEVGLSIFVGLFWLLLPLSLVATALATVECICIYKLIELCKPEKPLKNLLIGLLIPFAFPFVLLSCKHSLEATEEAYVLQLPGINI